MKKLNKEIEISASREKVWTVLVEKSYNDNWLSFFSAGTTASTDWIEGHKIIFTDNSNNGIIGKVTAKQPYEFIKITYEGVIENGVENYESEMAKAMSGTEETYELSDSNGTTKLVISVDMGEDYFDEMSVAWDAALQRISELSHAV